MTFYYSSGPYYCWNKFDYWLSSVGQVQAHDAVVGVEHGSIDGKVGGRARIWLDIDAPQSWVQVKSLQGSLLTQQFNLVDHFCSTIVSVQV